MSKLLKHLGLGLKKYSFSSSQENLDTVPDEKHKKSGKKETFSGGTAVAKRPLTRTGGGGAISANGGQPVWTGCHRPSPPPPVPPKKTSSAVATVAAASHPHPTPPVRPAPLPPLPRCEEQGRRGSDGMRSKVESDAGEATCAAASISRSSGDVIDQVVILLDYCDPADFCKGGDVVVVVESGADDLNDHLNHHLSPSSSSSTTVVNHPAAGSVSSPILQSSEDDDDYIVPIDVDLPPQDVNPEEVEDVTEGDEDVFVPDSYDAVYESSEEEQHQVDVDSRPEGEYDAPWEWGYPLFRAGRRAAADSSESDDMTGRQRHIYETAFDSSTVKASDDDDDLEIVNQSILTGSDSSASTSKSSTPKGTPGGTPKSIIRTVETTDNGSIIMTKERRKVTLFRGGGGGGGGGGGVGGGRCGEQQQVRAIIHQPPPTRSANSTPTLSYRAKEGMDSRASSAKSTPTHYSLTRGQHARPRIPVRQFSDLALGDNDNMASNKLGGPNRVGCTRRLPSDGVVSSEESVASTSSSSSSSNNNSRGSIDNHCRRDTLPKSLVHQSLDDRPNGDYDLPWDVGKKERTPFRLPDLSGATTECGSRSSSENSVSNNSSVPNKPSLHLPIKIDLTPTPPLRGTSGLSLNLNSPKRKRVNLQLNFGCATLIAVGEVVDPTISLERQGWYHGAISRVDAENVLRVLKEGSYLVRNSESSKQDYSLSLKSTRGFMHMKIVHSDGKYILGQFSKPFSSIPDMVHHYSINKLPIRGAEHMSLLHPVMEQLL